MTIYETILNNKEYLEDARKVDTFHFIADGKWDW